MLQAPLHHQMVVLSSVKEYIKFLQHVQYLLVNFEVAKHLLCDFHLPQRLDGLLLDRNLVLNEFQHS